jgi:hypothetical protein
MKTIFSFCFVLFSLFSIASTELSFEGPFAGNCFFSKKITLPAGTLILLETTETLDASQMTIGQLIQFKIKTDVLVDGEKVVATGAQATGRVKDLSKGTYNSPGTVTIEITYVQAVDGQQVSMNGMEQQLKGYHKGQSATIQTGTAISAYVMNDTCIKTR